jgi:hypothetical protein
MGQLVQVKGTSDGVRAYGQMLQQDHSAEWRGENINGLHPVSCGFCGPEPH